MATNISVTLTIDNKSYIAELGKAEGQTKQFAQTAKTAMSDANDSFSKLNVNTGALTTGITKLKTVIAGAAFLGFAKSAIAMADAINDLSQATGIGVNSIVAFQQATITAGGNAEGAAKGLQYFYTQIDAAAEGSGRLQAVFGELNIGLKDLANLTEQELFMKTVEGLAKMEQSAHKTALQSELLGKSFRGVTIDESFVQKLRDGDAATTKMAESIKRAAELNDKWEESISKIRIAFLEAFEPIVSGLADLLDKMPSLITAFKVLGTIIVATFVASGLRSFISLLGMAGRGVSFIADGLGKLNIGRALTGGAANKGITGLRDAASAVGLGGGLIAGAAAFFGGSEENKKEEEATKKNAGAQREVEYAYKRKVAEIERSAQAFAKANAHVIDNINTENQLIGKSKEYGDVIKAQEELYKRSADEIDRLRAAKEQLTKDELAGGVGKAYDEQIAKIQKLTAAESDRLKRSIDNSNMLQNAEKVRLYGIQHEIDMNNQLLGIQGDLAKIGMSEIEKKYYDIDAAAKASARSAIQAEESRLNRKLTPEEAQKYYDISIKGTEALKAKQSELYEVSRQFSTGWNNALREYVDNATNAANQAQQIFSKVTSSMEDAFVNFAKTGKFEFKSMINSILEDLLRMQVKASIAKIMGLGSGGTGATGGLFGGKIIPGILASGGPVSGNRPYIVGERGPELFLPDGNGSMVPNKDLMGGGQSVVYNIQAVDAPSFQALVARDPSFIHAVAMAGARSYPTSRR